MDLFELVIALLLVGAVLALVAERIRVPYPSLLALSGAAVALIPGTPAVTLDPELALALFVAPVLLDAAYDASPRDLKKNLLPVAALAIIAVGLTIAAVAIVARHFVPSMPWAAALALGAIVAPPDASAATAVLRRLRPPHRLMVILEGESLFNDATALLAYRIAVGAAMTGAFSGWSLLPTLLLTCGGGIVAGIALARIYLWSTSRVEDVSISIVLQFIGTFGVWILAEHAGLSAIITVVAYAMTIARYAPARFGGRARIESYAVWSVAVFVLNVLAFVLIGLQFRGIIGRIEPDEWRIYLLCAGAVCGAVVVVRFVWVMAYHVFGRWTARFDERAARAVGSSGSRSDGAKPTAGGAILVSWSGMRGIVTLAAALALPDGAGNAFPHRDLIVFCAFCVVVATLVVQGMTLGPLLHLLRLRDDGSVERELEIARTETARAALKALDDQPSDNAVELLRREYQARIRPAGGRRDASETAELQRCAVQAQRETLLDLRARGVIGDDAFHAAEEELDLLEITADPRIRPDVR